MPVTDTQRQTDPYDGIRPRLRSHRAAVGLLVVVVLAYIPGIFSPFTYVYLLLVITKSSQQCPTTVAQHRPTGSETTPLKTLPEAEDLAQNRPLWIGGQCRRRLYGATQS